MQYSILFVNTEISFPSSVFKLLKSSTFPVTRNINTGGCIDTRPYLMLWDSVGL